jgi:hypothetical protein
MFRSADSKEDKLVDGVGIPAQDLAVRIRAGVEAFFLFAEENPAAILILLSPPRSEKKLYQTLQTIQDEATQSITQMILGPGVQVRETDSDFEQLKIQVEFIKQGLHALAECRTQHPEISRGSAVDAVSTLICSGLFNEVSKRSRSS